MRIIMSRAGYGKTSRLLKEIYGNKNQGRCSYLMVPEQFTLQTELFVMEKMQSDALTEVQVMSFERLSEEVLRRCGGLKRPYIDEVGKHMALRRIFEEYSEEIQLYKTAFLKEGFIAELSHTLSEFKKMSIDSKELVEKSKKIEERLLSNKLYEVGKIYAYLDEYMQSRYVDNDDRIGLLAEKVSEAEYLKEILLYFDSFSGFTALELKVIEELCRMGVSMCFTLTCDCQEGGAAFEKTQRTLKQLQEIDGNYGKRTEIEVIERSHEGRPMLLHLERFLYSYPAPSFSDKEKEAAVTIYEALSMEEEIEHTAEEIVRLVLDHQYRYRDILVVTSAPEVYAPKLDRVFSQYRLPHFMDIKRDILGSGLMGMLFSFLDMLIYHLSYEDVFSLLKSGFTQLDVSQCNILENFCLKWGIHGKRWHQDKFFVDPSYLEGFESAVIQQGREYILDLYQRGIKNLLQPLDAKAYSQQIFELLSFMQIKQKNDELAERLRAAGEADYANEVVQIWNVLLDTMDQLVEIMGEQKLTLKEYRDILQEGISGQKVGVIPPMADQIITATMDRSRNTSVKALFFLGVNEGYVPRIMKESPILQEEDKMQLRQMGISLPSEIGNRNAENNFILYTLVSKPTERLFLSYSLSDAEGKTLRHAELIDRVRFLIPTLAVQGGFRKKELNEEILLPEITFERLSEKLRDYVEVEDIETGWFTVYHWFKNSSLEEYHTKTKQMLKGLFYQNDLEGGKQLSPKKLYAPMQLSATRIERFAACPFAHFIDYGLRPKERKVYEMDGLELGRVFHSAVEKFAVYLQQGSAVLTDQSSCDELIDNLIDESLTQGVRILMDNSKRNAYMLKKMKKLARHAAWTMWDHYRKGRFEIFGQEVEIKEGRLCMKNGESLSIRAKVDRVDILREDGKIYVKIIDYKSGSKTLQLSDIYDGMNIQLIFYLKLMMELISERYELEALPAGAFYFYLDDRPIATESEDPQEIMKLIEKESRMEGMILKEAKVLKAIDENAPEEMRVVRARLKSGELSGELVFTEKEFKSLINHVLERMGQLAESLSQGDISVSPYLKEGFRPCDYCGYHSICKFDERLGNRYRKFRKKSREEIWDQIGQSGQHHKKGGDKS